MHSGNSIRFLALLDQNFYPGFYSLSEELLEKYDVDTSGEHRFSSSGIVFPKTTQEVSLFLKFCFEFNQKVIPLGGWTGLVQGTFPTSGEWLLSLERLNQILSLDPLSQTVTVQAGVVTQKVQEYLSPFGLEWPVRFASEGSSQIGGNLATNVGGVNVIRYGMSREWVLGLKVVLSTGEILDSLNSPKKNNSGYDLKQLFIGSEGTLGVITEACLLLSPLEKETETFLCGFDHYTEIEKLFLELNNKPLIPLRAFEVFDQACLESVLKNGQLRSPIGQKNKYYVLFELASDPLLKDPVFQIVSQWMEQGVLGNVFYATQVSHKKEIWSLRENISESLKQLGTVQKYDLSVSINLFFSFIESLEFTFQKDPKINKYARLFFFGHMGDGNVHFNLVYDPSLPQEKLMDMKKHADEIVSELLIPFKGSISAEHGIGLLKKTMLYTTRTPLEIEYFRKIKKIFDPKGLLNPGKIFNE